MGISFYSTNNKSLKVNFESALLAGLAPDYGLYMMAREEIPLLSKEKILSMKEMTYAQIAFEVLNPFLSSQIPSPKLKALLDDAYREDKIPTKIQSVADGINIMWLSNGPTYSFKDYAARFFGRTLNYFLGKRGLKRIVVVATSGDTGGAVADALYGLDNVENIVFFPKGSVSDGQRRQMTTLGKNIYAFEVNGDFDVCQSLAKSLLNDKKFAAEVFGDKDRLTSANSISVGRLLPQSVYPFYAYSRIAKNGEELVASIPSGNFGDMMGTVIAKQMGLPISKIICGVNENKEFPEFLSSGNYKVYPSVKSPSSAMIVSHPSNLARLIDFYGGHMYDERDASTKKVLHEGVIDKMPDILEMRRDLFSISIDNPQHYRTMKDAYQKYKVILDPHGAVGWRALEIFFESNPKSPAVIYETADPGKFPEDVKRAIGITPPLPEGMKKQAKTKERIYSILCPPLKTEDGIKLSDEQVSEAKQKIANIFKL